MNTDFQHIAADNPAILGFIYGTKPAADGRHILSIEQSFGRTVRYLHLCRRPSWACSLAVSEYRERKIPKRFRVTPVHPARLL